MASIVIATVDPRLVMGMTYVYQIMQTQRHYVVIALLSAVSSARMRPWLIFVIPCGFRSVFSKPSLRHSLSLLAWWQRLLPTYGGP